MARKPKKPIKIITIDTETYNGLIGGLKRIACYDGEQVTYGYVFADIEKVLLDYAKKYEVHCYIHNLEFDARKIPEIFDKDRILWKNSLAINGKLATIACKEYIIHDSFKLLPMSLKKLSKGFNVEHGKLDLWESVQERYKDQYKDIVDFLDRCDRDNPLYLEYLGYDVISLYEVLQVLIGIAGLSESDFVKRISTASLSRHLFKTGYKGKEFKGEFSNKTDYEKLCSYKWYYDLSTEEFIRETYCGGRTEVFKPKLEKDGFHYDVNSLYPYVMSLDINTGAAAQYPIGKPQYTDRPAVAEQMYRDWQEYKSGLGFVNCRVFIPDQPIPPLPVKMGKLTFPCGEVYGSWTYEELEYAEKNCGVEIREFIAAVHFKETYPIFHRFVETFYKLKEEGTRTKNEPLRTLAKLILNVGYGYTGMRRDDKTGLDSLENAPKHKHIVSMNEHFGFIEVPTEIKSEFIQVQVASYVTSRARLVLLKALRDIVNRGGNVYYCDTDSVVCDIPINPDLVDSEKIGFWDLESTPKKGLFLRPKVYTEIHEEETIVKFKGVSRETQEQLDFKFYEDMYIDLETGEKEFLVVEKNRLTMRSILYMQKTGLDFDYYETRDKKINYQTVEKRVMDYKGNSTHAHFFPTIEDFEKFSYKKAKPTVVFDMKKGQVIE